MIAYGSLQYYCLISPRVSVRAAFFSSCLVSARPTWPRRRLLPRFPSAVTAAGLSCLPARRVAQYKSNLLLAAMLALVQLARAQVALQRERTDGQPVSCIPACPLATRARLSCLALGTSPRLVHSHFGSRHELWSGGLPPPAFRPRMAERAASEAATDSSMHERPSKYIQHCSVLYSTAHSAQRTGALLCARSRGDTLGTPAAPVARKRAWLFSGSGPVPIL